MVLWRRGENFKCWELLCLPGNQIYRHRIFWVFRVNRRSIDHENLVAYRQVIISEHKIAASIGNSFTRIWGTWQTQLNALHRCAVDQGELAQ